MALGTMAVAALMAGSVLAQPASWFDSTYPRTAIPTLSRLIARDPHATIFADVRYADWLIWERPALFAGRVAYDTSFELLTRSQLETIADIAARSTTVRAMLDRYPIWMLYPANHETNRKLLRRPGVHVVSRSRRVIIATHGLG
jgi:hypothetical protein